LRAFWTLGDLEFHLIALLQAFVAFGGYGAVVDENIRSTFASNESVTFSIVEPLHSPIHTFHERPLGHVLLRVVPYVEAIVRPVNASVKISYDQKPCI